MSASLEKKLAMIEIAMPTDEELGEWARERCAKTAAFSLHRLPEMALAMSIKTEFFLLSGGERLALIDTWRCLNGEDLEGGEARASVLLALAARLDRGVAAVGGRAFVRLGTRSPKDSYEIMGDAQAACVTTGKRAVFLLTNSMERVLRDLDDDRRADVDSYVCVREWRDIKPWQELRCFIEDGRLAGISQYHCDDGPIPEMISRRQQIEAAARAYLTGRVMPALGCLPSYTADLIFDDALRMTLLEVNPPVTSGSTYPALFADGELDGSFRILDAALKEDSE